MPVYTFTTFDDPDSDPGTTEAWGINDEGWIVGAAKVSGQSDGLSKRAMVGTPSASPGILGAPGH
jgi:hypothetical protein